ncbi:MAG: hypothetical protein ACI97N_001448 [Cognaticolwellia sp.]|jgi:hypothetical protein
MKNLLFFCLFMAISFSAFSQGNIKGNVTDENSQPVEFANVLLLNAVDSSLAKGNLSDSNGTYYFDVSSGKYLIFVSMIGYRETYSEVFELGTGTFVVQPLSLGEGVKLDEIEVVARRPFIELSANKLIVNVESSPTSAGDNALEVLRKSPGVQVDESNNISLKGKQGVLIMIDGKRSYLSNTEVARMLESMPSSSINQIEIIMNPSAKYDAEGNAGIINIKMKKDKNLGFNGNITAGGSYGEYPGANGNFTFNYRQKTFNVFGNVGSWYNKGFQINTLHREVPFNGMTTIFDQVVDRVNYSQGVYYRGGVDLFLTDKTTLGFLVNGNHGNWNFESISNTSISGDNQEVFSLVQADNQGRSEWDNLTYNVNLKQDFGSGKELTLDADYSTYKSGNNSTYDNFYLSNDQQVAMPYLLRSNNNSDIEIFAFKADYTHPINDKTSIEAGIKSSFVTTDNSVAFENKDLNDVWNYDSLQSNTFEFQENINAAYVNYNQSFDKITLQLGVRAENTNNEGYSGTLDSSLSRQYVSLFPNVSLSHKIGEDHSLSYSYTRRIDRPSYEDLNPFSYFLDQYTFERGNPFLNPQFTHSFNTSYGYKQVAFLTASYGRTTGAMTDVIEQIDSLNITFQTKINLATLDNVSINLSTPIPIQKWWMVRTNLSANFNSFQSEYVGGVIDNQQWSFNAYMANYFTVRKGTTAEISGWYQSKSLFGIIEIQPMYAVNIGFSQTVLDGKGTIKLSGNDILNTQRFRGIINQDNVNLTINNNWQTRRFSASFTYRFGNDKVKPSRRRETATDEEQKRAGSDNN